MMKNPWRYLLRDIQIASLGTLLVEHGHLGVFGFHVFFGCFFWTFPTNFKKGSFPKNREQKHTDPKQLKKLVTLGSRIRPGNEKNISHRFPESRKIIDSKVPIGREYIMLVSRRVNPVKMSLQMICK